MLHFPSPVESCLWPWGQGGATVSVVKAPGAPCSPQYFGCEGVLALLHYFGVGSLKKRHGFNEKFNERRTPNRVAHTVSKREFVSKWLAHVNDDKFVPIP